MSVCYVGFEYIEPNEIINNDRFSMSIMEIILKYRPSNKEELKKLLDANGYFGRHKIFEINKNGQNVKEIRVLVEMIWSKYSYTWPWKGTFSFETLSIIRTSSIKTDILLSDALDNFYDSHGYSIRQEGYARQISRAAEIKIRNIINEVNLLQFNEFVIANKIDLKELKKNVFEI